MVEWYATLSRLSAAVGEPLTRLADGIGVPAVSALVFGLIGATAPCQLTTNLSAIAFVSRRLGGGRPWWDAVSYTLAKALVYTILGALVIVLGREVQTAAVPVVVAARKTMGPLLVVMGLVLLGVFRPRFSVGQRLGEALGQRVSARGARGAFLLGLVFSLAFCPTLFLLFFGLTIPLALRSSAGLLAPALFAVGTALPLLAYAGLLAASAGLAATFIARLRRAEAAVRKIAAAVFLLAGINDTLVYWTL